MPCLVLLQVIAAQLSTCQDIGVGTREDGLTANAAGAMVTWLDARQMDGNANTIHRSIINLRLIICSQNSQDCIRFSEDLDSLACYPRQGKLVIQRSMSIIVLCFRG